MRKSIITLAIAILAVTGAVAANPKHEFRGAWMHTVFQPQYSEKSTDECKAYLRDQLDKLQTAGVNAVVFQVRPQADAFYPSELEPWSRFLTKDGKAPEPYWDPLQFMIDESHARGMELHAWLNPYRVTTNSKQTLPKNHVYYQHPEWFVTYDGKLYFDPGLPECRDFIESVVRDIVTRYDVDAVHMDDYFYPYPVKDQAFPDNDSYAKYGEGMDRGDWRRQNVNLLIKGIHDVIGQTKPWVRFGISPFGVFRNKSTWADGSDTQALQNYDDLYADVLLWTREGWVDYMLPQLYWELEHKRASYLNLVGWWNDHANSRHMYIGQDVSKTMSLPDLPPSTEKTQLRHKIELARQGQNIQGNCWWPGYAVTKNEGGVADSLARDLCSTIALVPNYPWIRDDMPEFPRSLRVIGDLLVWEPCSEPQGKVEDTVKFVVYYTEHRPCCQVDIEDPANIVAVVYGNSYKLPAGATGTYYVTALDRANNESMPSPPLWVQLK